MEINTKSRYYYFLPVISADFKNLTTYAAGEAIGNSHSQRISPVQSILGEKQKICNPYQEFGKWQPTPVFLPGESQGWGAWWASVYGVAQSQTRLKRLSSSSSSSKII